MGVAEAGFVFGYAFEEAFGDALAVVGVAELVGVGGVGDEGDLGEDGGHVGSDEDDEGSLFDAAVFEAFVGGRAGAGGQAGVEGLLDVGGELAGLLDLVLEGDFFDEVGELVDGLAGDGVLAGGDLEGVGGLGEVEVVGFDSAGGFVWGGVGVDGEEEVGLGLVGDGGAGFEGDEGVVGAGVDDLGAEALVEELA